MTETPPAGWSSSLRRKSCPLAGAMLRWVLFCVFLLAIHLSAFAGWLSSSLPNMLFLQTVVLEFSMGLEMTVLRYMTWIFHPLRAIVFSFPLLTVMCAAKLWFIFAWGASRLRRGKYAPYAETIWLFAIAGFVSRKFARAHIQFYPEIIEVRFAEAVVLLLLAGLVVFVLQRCWRPPARCLTCPL